MGELNMASIYAGFAAYYASDGFEWQQQGDEVNRLDIYRSPRRIVCTNNDGQLLFDCPLYAGCNYERPSEQFHQWTSRDGAAFGLSFATPEEADGFSQVVQELLVDLNTLAKNEAKQQAAPVKPASSAVKQQLSSSSVADNKPGTKQTGSNQLVLIKDAPATSKFQMCHNIISPADETWERLEIVLRFSHPACLRQRLQLTAATELASNNDVERFSQVYSDFTLSELWLNVNESTTDLVAMEGISTLSGKSFSGIGVPLGMYAREDFPRTSCKLILCKVALGRSLPMAPDMISAMEDCMLPVGYHSLSTMQAESSEGTLVDSQIDFTRFEQNFLVQNYALVLPTHLVTYDISQESDESSAPPPLNGSMSVVSLRPAALDDKHKEAILSVCDQEAVSRAGSNLSFAVDQSYQALWSEVFSLSNSLGSMKSKLTSCASNIEAFREASTQRADSVREDLVSYLAHSLQVEQAIHIRQFRAKRLMSDTKRLQDLYAWLRETSSRDGLLVSWSQLGEMRDATATEIDDLMAEPALHPQTMALTTTNKRLVALRREASLRDRLIEKLADCLRRKGALKEEDEELIAGF